MTALQIECTCCEWWGRHWPHSEPFVLNARQTSSDSLENAPVNIFVLTRNPHEAAQLLRLAADALEQEPELLERLERLDRLECEPQPDGGEVPF